MTQLSELHGTVINYDDLENLSSRLVPVIEPQSQNDQPLQRLAADVEAKLTTMRDRLNLSRKSIYTAKLALLDEARDDSLRAFKYAIVAWTYRSIRPEQQQIAKKLSTRFADIGSVTNEGYKVESNIINRLIHIFDSPELQQHISQLNLDDWYTELKQSQQAFEQTTMEKTTKQAETRELPQLTEAFDALLESVQKLFGYLRAMMSVDAGVYEPVVARVDELVDEVMAGARARRARGEGGKETGMIQGEG